MNGNNLSLKGSLTNESLIESLSSECTVYSMAIVTGSWAYSVASLIRMEQHSTVY